METFIRKELKFLIDDKTRDQFLAAAAAWLKPDLYPDCSIYSIYLDTPDFDLMRLCEGKPDYKCKARLRAYRPVSSADDQVFFELKKKIEGTCCKRRKEFTRQSLKIFWENHQADDAVGREIRSLLEQYPLEPRFSLFAHRRCWVWKDDPSLRLTFDDVLTWRSSHHGLFRHESDRTLLEPGMNVFEIKCSGGLPLELCRLLETLQIRQSSFSKAGQVYARLLERNPVTI